MSTSSHSYLFCKQKPKLAQRVAKLEQELTGSTVDGPLKVRVQSLEMELLGELHEGSLPSRVDRLETELL